jgi:hypothetical protein
VLGLPFAGPASKVVLLEDMPTDLDRMRSAGELDLKSFVSVQTTSGDRLGILIPASAGSSSLSSRVLRPVVDGSIAAINERGVLWTSSEGDLAFLRSEFQLSTSEQIVSIVGIDESPVKNKLQHKLDALCLASAEGLKMFGTAQWDAVKESALTKFVNSLSSIHIEASHVGLPDVIEKSATWLNGMTHGKQFIKLHREYVKANHKYERLSDLFAPLSVFRDFMSTVVKQAFAPAAALLFYKTLFIHQVDRGGIVATSKALQCLFDNGLQDVLDELSKVAASTAAASSVVSPDAWLRSVLFKSLGFSVSIVEDVSSLESTARDLLQDVLGCIKLMKKYLPASVQIIDFLADLDHYSVLLQGACEQTDVVASDIDAALKHMHTLRFRPLFVDLTKGALGKAIVAASTCLLQASAKDTCGNEKLALASSILSDTRLPAVAGAPADGDVDCDGSITNFNQLTEMVVIDSLEESLSSIAEAVRLWSPFQIEKQVEGIGAWATKIVETMAFYDEALSVFLHAVVREPLGDILWPTAGVEEPALEEELTAFAKFKGGVLTMMVDETPLEEFAQKLVTFLQGLPISVKRKLDTKPFIDKLESHVLFNIRARSRIVDFLDRCANFPSFPKDNASAFDEWVAKRAYNCEATSFFAHAVELLGWWKELPKMPLKLNSDGGKLNMVLQEDELVTKYSGSFAMATELPVQILNLKLPAHVQQALCGVFQYIVDTFAQSLDLGAMHAVSGASASQEECLAEMMDQFFHKPKVSDMVKVAAKVFGNARQELDWPSVVLYKLVEALSSSIPDGVFMVSLHAFCQAGAEPVQLSDKKQLHQLCTVFMGMSQACSTIAYIRCRLLQERGESCLRDGQLKSEVESAVMFLRATSNKMVDQISKGEFGDWNLWDTMSWLMPLRYCLPWLQRLRACMPRVCRHFLVKLVDYCALISEEVSKVTPRTEHVVSGDKLSEALARKHILGWPSRDVLSTKTVVLFNSTRAVSRLHAHWGLSPALDQDPDFSEALTAGKLVFMQAKETITIIAALNVILELKGSEQQTQAAALATSRSQQLPAAIMSRLKAIIDKASKPSA